MRYQASVLALLASVAPVAAQDAFTLNPIIFSAGLTATEAIRTGASVEVLTAEDLEAAGDVQLSDVLDTLPGIEIAQNGPPGTQTALRIRGLDGRYIPVLINGINITDPSATQTLLDFGGISAAGIERVEVLYGSQSALYGSEAIAGVISITTAAAPDEIGTEGSAFVEAGSYDTFRAGLTVGSRTESGTLSFSIDRVETDGFSAAEENVGNTEDDGFSNTTITLNGTHQLSDDLSIGISLYAQDGAVDIDAFAGPGGDDPTRFNESERRAARVFLTYSGDLIEHEVSASVAVTDRFDSGFGGSFFEGTREELRYLGTVDVGDTTITFGAERGLESFDSTFSSGAIDTNALFVDATTAISSDLDLSGSLRYDDHGLFGGETTGRVALAWRPGADTVIRASLGTGFRSPSLFELFSGFGDPSLTPETSRSAELGIERQFNWGQVGAAIFYTEIDDLIDFDAAAVGCAFGPGCYTQIPGTTVSQGVELTGTVEITPSWELYGNYTYTDARTEDARLARVPRHAAVLGLNGEITADIGLDIRARAAVDTAIGSFDPNPLDDYVVVDTTVTYAVNDAVEAYLRIDNLFDEEYQTVSGFGTSDRAFYIGARTRF